MKCLEVFRTRDIRNLCFILEKLKNLDKGNKKKVFGIEREADIKVHFLGGSWTGGKQDVDAMWAMRKADSKEFLTFTVFLSTHNSNAIAHVVMHIFALLVIIFSKKQWLVA